jgi:hypothetical protein
LLQTSPDPLVQAFVRIRSLTNTLLFPPSSSPAGQALDTAISIGGTLAEAGHFSTRFSDALLALATNATFDGNPQPLEQSLMDLMSLGQRFNWGQLATLVEHINDAETLRILSDYVRRGEQVPVLYSTICLSGNAADVARFITTFSETGCGITELLRRNQRLCDSRFCERTASLISAGTIPGFALDYARQSPSAALAARWLLYLLGGFSVACADSIWPASFYLRWDSCWWCCS